MVIVFTAIVRPKCVNVFSEKHQINPMRLISFVLSLIWLCCCRCFDQGWLPLRPPKSVYNKTVTYSSDIALAYKLSIHYTALQ